MAAVDRPRGSLLVAATAGLSAVAVAVAASGPWTYTPGALDGVRLWSVSMTTAVGTAALILGCVLVAAAQLTAPSLIGATRVSAVGCVLALLGAGFALVELRVGRDVGFAPVTVAIAGFSVGPPQGTRLSDATAVPTTVFVVAGVLVVLTVIGALIRSGPSEADTSRATRPTAVVAAVGAVVLAVGASVLPWSVGDDLRGRLLWSDPAPAVGAGVVLAAAVAVVVLVRGAPAVRAGVVTAIAAAVAGAVVVAGHSALIHRRYLRAYPLILDDRTAGVPTANALNAAALTVYAGTGLVVLAALATVSVSVLRAARPG
jgi:hypothetical protein